MKILIMKFRNIGDVLLSTPLISNLKYHYPNAIIDFALNKGCEDMLSDNPYVDNIIIYDRPKIKQLNSLSRLKEELVFAYQIRQNHYDVVINLTEGDRGAQLALFSGAEHKLGFPVKKGIFSKLKIFDQLGDDRKVQHTVEKDLQFVSLLEKTVTDKSVKIYWPDSVEDEVGQILQANQIKGFVHVHPVSRWLFKCIADQAMADIIDYCELELGLKVVVTAAPVEQEVEKVGAILDLCQSQPINLSGVLSLKQTAALNKKAQLFIGVDTAIMHLSAANNVPVVAFFGPSGAFHWGPWDNNLMASGYKEKNGVQTMGVHSVFAESRACQPCGQDGCNGTKVSDCLMHLDLDSVKQMIANKVN